MYQVSAWQAARAPSLIDNNTRDAIRFDALPLQYLFIKTSLNINVCFTGGISSVWAAVDHWGDLRASFAGHHCHEEFSLL